MSWKEYLWILLPIIINLQGVPADSMIACTHEAIRLSTAQATSDKTLNETLNVRKSNHNPTAYGCDEGSTGDRNIPVKLPVEQPDFLHGNL